MDVQATYAIPNGWRIVTQHGTFDASTEQQARLDALIAENDARYRKEQRDAARQYALDVQDAELKLREKQR